MKYFIVKVDENYRPPMATNWYGKIDKETLRKKKLSQMSKHMIFLVEKNMQMVFTDILTFPCFMVSELIRNTIKMYMPYIRFLRIVLFDKENSKSMTYYIPYLEKINFVKTEDIYIKNIHQISVEKATIEDKVIVEIIHGNETYVVMRMDLIESILRRGAVGVGLKKIEIV